MLFHSYWAAFQRLEAMHGLREERRCFRSPMDVNTVTDLLLFTPAHMRFQEYLANVIDKYDILKSFSISSSVPRFHTQAETNQ